MSFRPVFVTRKRLFFSFLAVVLMFSSSTVGTASAPGIERDILDRAEFGDIDASMEFISNSILNLTK